ncbi:YchJ family protein [Thalassolituus sp. LLYu03]|uniref:YchJ family protein n=1 Tax=Thalassolituus sp. LLYu03 TaxID=3421656 RepID=UPI003D26BB01
MSQVCPCGSGLDYRDCCEPLHQGVKAASPEALMRSRYSAFALELSDYLLNSWDARTRPAELTLQPDTRWFRLDVQDSGAQGDEGFVRFTAYFREGDEWLQLSERSRFALAEDGYWRYLDGNADFRRWSPGRNDECPCGSGKKFKKCCGG